MTPRELPGITKDLKYLAGTSVPVKENLAAPRQGLDTLDTTMPSFASPDSDEMVKTVACKQEVNFTVQYFKKTAKFIAIYFNPVLPFLSAD
jgi:hypothetical protein